MHAILVIYVGFCCTLHSLSPSLFATSCFLPVPRLLRLPSNPILAPSFQTSFSLSETNTVFLLARLSCCKSSNATATSLRPFYSARYSGPLLRSPPPEHFALLFSHKSHIVPKTINMSLAEHSVRQSEKAATHYNREVLFSPHLHSAGQTFAKWGLLNAENERPSSIGRSLPFPTLTTDPSLLQLDIEFLWQQSVGCTWRLGTERLRGEARREGWE